MMTPDIDWVLFAVGFVRVLIWWIGAVLALYRKRYLLTVGFGLAGLAAIPLTFDHAQAPIDQNLVDVAWLVSTVAVGLIVASFVAVQPRRLERPTRWAP